MMNRLQYSTRPCALCAVAGLALSSVVRADPTATLLWNNAAGGSAGTAGNWNPVGVPAAADFLNFNLAGNYSISFPASVPTSSQMNFNVGTIGLSTLVPHTATAQFTLGILAASTPTVTFTSGTLSSAVISVGSNPTSTSILNITGAAADMLSTGAAGTRIGNTGNGTLNITTGGSLRSTNAVTVAAGAGSQGAVNVSGLSGATRSELVTLDPVGGDLNIALNGPGSLAVTLGAKVVVADDAFIAPTTGFTGTAAVGSTSVNDSTMDIAGDLHIGHNTTAAAAGTGTYTINDGGLVTVAGTTTVGDSAGGTGTLTVHEGGQLTTASLAIDSSHGVFNLLGGIIAVTGGTLSTTSNQITLNGGVGESPILSINGGALCTLSATPTALTIGTTRSALLDVSNNGSLNVTAGDIVLGESLGSNGTLQVQLAGQATLAPSGTLTVGKAGSGALTLSANGHMASGPVQAGTLASSTSSVFISNSSSLDITGTLALGGTFSTSGGTASMTIGNASPNTGTVTVTSGPIAGGVNTQVWNGSSLTINAGGRLNSDEVIRCGGSLTLAGGTIDADNVVPGGAGPFSFTGTIVHLLEPLGSTVVNLTGPLAVQALRNHGTMNVGPHTLTINDTPGHHSWFIGNCTLLALGRVVAPDGLILLTGEVISGEGTIDAPITNSGTLTGSGTGLKLNGLVTGLGQGITGTAVTFGATGGFTGQGTFGASVKVNAQAGSVITATGNLTMGNAASNQGFASAGKIVVGDNIAVSLRSLSFSVVHDLTFSNGDPASAPSVLSGTGLMVNGRVSGTGTIGGSVSTQIQLIGATLSPGVPGIPGAPGSIFLDGDTFFGNNTRTEIDIFDATTHDQIRSLSHLVFSPSFHTVPSDVVLFGTLVLRVEPGHTPTSGETHQILATNHGLFGPDGVVYGAFESYELPRHWIINTIPFESPGQENGVFAVYCTADFNEDGVVDFFDYDDFVVAFEAGLPEADYNNDTAIDFFDYDDFVVDFEQGC